MDALENIKMTERERIEISSFIESEFGIKMPAVKKILLTSRLSKRLNLLGCKSYADYYRFIRSAKGADEFLIFADLVSTHETSFFRESQHFELMFSRVLPDLCGTGGAGIRRSLRVLSAACSTGEEAYTLAITIEEFRRKRKLRSFNYRITGTDISTKVLSSASRGVYGEGRVGKLPDEYMKKYFMRGKNEKRELVRVVPELRANAEFMHMNLMDKSYPFRENFDIIFCRNALIYFDRENQKEIIRKLTSHLSRNGYLFIGHSETMAGYDLPLRCVEPTVYRRI
ncbi:MAG TPA: CheR family methyltransferase [Spirochaetota bacterium]|nr:CheR family methyltransferase [Spirochaetota bacterium]HPF05105.1 CheR family methyltransferase [Spirochaetota bacterium]HPJ41510.1 CheR family methyltransferase [Spirochaetota bacterium]HPR37709.1 CheR family methyltransferase [Spirochaetota bacterium]HRX46558.1 CheR family methyltransferase [Spirochaetota bacterium]